MAQKITFHGAAETVTGSRHLLELDGHKYLVDCGLFQGTSDLKERNWQPFPVPPNEIEAIILTHAHMDHMGYIPRLVAQGFNGPVYATKATIQLARISLPDSGRIQEEDAYHHNKHGSSHKPALPLYTEKDAYTALKQFEPVPYREMQNLPGSAGWRFLPAGHILGSAFAEIYFQNGERILMSGDLGRYNTPIIKDPTIIENAEYLVVESTYGDRIHSNQDTKKILEQVLHHAGQNSSCVLVPSFSIGRTQELLYFVSELQDEGKIPRIPIYVDSPMATSTTSVYRRAYEEHDEEMKLALDTTGDPLEPDLVTFVRDSNQSKALNSQDGPMMIIAGSGMMTGGRIVHHVLHRGSDPNTTILFTGYQANGTLGRRIIEGDDRVRIYGQDIKIRAQVEKLNSLSAHADQGEIMNWLGNFKNPPKLTCIVHGEPPAQAALKTKIIQELGWDVVIPTMGESFDL